MNAQAIWAGSDYAYHDYRKRGVEFQHGAQRVRAIGVTKEKLYGNAKDTAFVKVYLIDENGEIRKNNVTNEPRTAKIRARDISMRWDEYEAELKHREDEENRKLEDARLLREVHKRDVDFILEKMEQKGFDMGRVEITDHYYGNWVKIPIPDMKRWLRDNE